MENNIKLAPMKFKNFTWPHNPTIYEMENTKKIISHAYVDKNYNEIEDMGTNSRIMTGRGVFFGPDAYQQWRDLYMVYLEKGPGTLIHPIWAPMEVVMTRLRVTHNPTPEYVEYEFEFVQHVKINRISYIKTDTPSSGSASSNNAAATTNSITYTVKRGDTLWDIANRYYGNSQKYRDIANANKNLIKNPNLIYPGWKLTIPNPTRNV